MVLVLSVIIGVTVMCVLRIGHCRKISSVILLILYVYNNVMDLAKGFVQCLAIYFFRATGML